MRKLALISGLVWMAIAVAIFGVLWMGYATTGQLRGAYGLVFVLFALTLPGALLYRWGKGPFVRPPSSADNLRPKAPYNLAHEMGHIMRLNRRPDV